MLVRSRLACGAWCLAVAASSSACTSEPTAAPALDKVGLYFDVDGGTANRGFAQAPASGWPPQLLATDPTLPLKGAGCRDDKTQLETNLALKSIACPSLQQAKVPDSGNADAAIVGGDADQAIGGAGANAHDATQPNPRPKPNGANLRCYELAGTILIVRYRYYETMCTVLVDLGLFHER